MKQLLMALLFPVALSAQKKDVVKLTHTNYTTYFSKSKKYRLYFVNMYFSIICN